MSLDTQIAHAVECIEKETQIRPKVGLILGSGLGALADIIEQPVVLPYREIPGFPISHVSGHAGVLVIGSISGVPVIAMKGRAHLYEGWTTLQATFPLRVMHALGIDMLMVSNASGGINPRFHSGQIVLIDSHINLMPKHGISEREHRASAAFCGTPSRAAGGYNEKWMQVVEATAIELGFSIPRGTYLATLGPNYESRAEYRAFAKLGADMVGMSTVPEVIVAAQLGLPVVAFSIVTNVARPDAPTSTDHEEVLDWSNRAQAQMLPLVRVVLKEFSRTN